MDKTELTAKNFAARLVLLYVYRNTFLGTRYCAAAIIALSFSSYYSEIHALKDVFNNYCESESCLSILSVTTFKMSPLIVSAMHELSTERTEFIFV